ncbi:MAG: hypothetical protein ACXADY_24765 [Candidatus Hodarchaeales archaeon]
MKRCLWEIIHCCDGTDSENQVNTSTFRDFEEAILLLSEAKQIAEKKKLGNILLKVKIEQETIQAELDKWNELIQRKASIQERVEHAQIASCLVEAKKIQETWSRPSLELLKQ